MNIPSLQATAVVSKNSIAFVEQVFALYGARRPLVTVSNASQAEKLPGVVIDRCVTPEERSGWFTAQHPLIHDDLPAQVTYTSGTEGLPKGILLTYANLADAAERIIDQMKMTAEVREYVGVPATFSFGMARYRAISAVGGRAYLPPRGFDPMELARMLAAGEVNSLSAVPTLLRILLATPEVIGQAGKNLRWMEIGSQHMTSDEKRRIRDLFPNALIVQHYGLTEASRSTFLQISDAPAELLDSVGRPVGRTETQVGADGRIRIRGPHVAKSRVDANGLHDLQDADGWLQTNDLGHMRDGYLFFDGRADDLINFGGIKIVPDQLEDRMRSRLGAGVQIAVTKVPDAQRGDGVLVAAKTDASDVARVREAAVASLRDMGIDAGGSLHVMPVDTIPATGTGKVQRSVLAAQFVAQQPKVVSNAKPAKGEISDVRSLFEHEFPGQKVGPDDTFESLGGDSLHYIKFSLSFEQRFGPLPTNWERMTPSALQELVGKSEKTFWRRLESVTVARAFFMICIVALHTDAFVYSPNWGAAYFLVMLAGYSVARWQLPEIIRAGSVKTLLRTIRYVAIPTVLMVAVMQLLTHKFEVTPLLLVSNFLDPHTLKGYLFYFVEFYIQLLLLSALLFSFASVREAFRARPMVSALVVLVAVVAIDRTVEHFWNTDFNYHRVPWHYAWTFALGMVLAGANDMRTRFVALAVSIVAVSIVWGPTSAAFYVGGGCAIVLFVRAFVVPAPVKVLVAEIAGASMFIYLSHSQMISIVTKIYGHNKPWLSLISAIIVGTALTHAYAWCERRFAQLRQGAH
ncbi:MAG: AMP-binding protein [Hydrogenophaga sp.]|jgi:acyl-CoA synthetase (AMP-forming)/AMP-acid ligase II/peptidoglycan/LPS O-acetylase OafA/YrhL|uniref:AMP-binding protein n=1 Tax=Hydrogenophaga sp. TaxID=1904254 RepID=UPI001D9725CC|nr:AMP-binding protein [Hydrogenophaga sp.]MBW0172305.1 AMP-binding protein [Hydrogenophaga sp.]MBW0183814.1 AMP-binding protein [Hydrogenophaga sp.]